MQFRLLSAFENPLKEAEMRVFYRQLLVWGLATFSALLSLNSEAAVTINAVSPYSLVSGNLIHYAVAGVTVDSGAGFHAFDLTASSGENDLVYLDISSSKTFSLTIGQDVVVTVIAEGQESSPVPIARAGVIGSVADCSASSNCQGFSGGLYRAAKFPVSPSGQVLRLGFYPKQICEAIGSVSGVCDNTDVVLPVSGTPTEISLEVYVGIENTDGDFGLIQDSEDHHSVSLRFQDDIPITGICPLVSSFYFPGDSGISFDPSSFSGSFTVSYTHLTLPTKA